MHIRAHIRFAAAAVALATGLGLGLDLGVADTASAATLTTHTATLTNHAATSISNTRTSANTAGTSANTAGTPTKVTRTLTNTARTPTNVTSTLTNHAAVAASVVQPAASCSGNGCDGKWPIASGCSATEETAESAVIKYKGTVIGEIDLRYSTACRTVWARIISDYAGGVGEFAVVNRNSDGAVESCNTWVFSGDLGDWSCYTQMLYDGGVTSYAYGAATNPTGTLSGPVSTNSF